MKPWHKVARWSVGLTRTRFYRTLQQGGICVSHHHIMSVRTTKTLSVSPIQLTLAVLPRPWSRRGNWKEAKIWKKFLRAKHFPKVMRTFKWEILKSPQLVQIRLQNPDSHSEAQVLKWKNYFQSWTGSPLWNKNFSMFRAIRNSKKNSFPSIPHNVKYMWIFRPSR